MKKLPGILRSSASMTLARVLSSICAFILFWFISQRSVGDLGAFRTIFVFFLFSEFLPLLGTNQLLIREVSISSDPVKKYLLHSFLFALPVSLFIALGFVLIGIYGKYSLTISKGLLIVALGMPATSLVLCAQSSLIGVGRGDLFGIVQGGEAFIRTTAGVILLFLGYGVLSIVIAFIVVRWVITILYWKFLTPYLKDGKWNFDFRFFKNFLREVPPFAGILVCYLLLRFAPQVMLPWMKDEVAAGHFAVAFQFLDLALLAPTAFAINLMPVFSQKAGTSIDDLLDYCHQAIKVVSLIVVGGVVLVYITANPLVLKVFGDKYFEAVPILKLLIWVAIILTVDQLLAVATIACKKQIYDLLSLFIGATITIIFLYFLIAQNGALGAAKGYFLGTMVLIASRILLVRRFMPRLNPVVQLWRPGVAGVLVIIVARYLNCHWLWIPIIGILIYTFFVFVLGAFKGSERIAMKRLLQYSVQR